jgi:hypothetical protein
MMRFTLIEGNRGLSFVAPPHSLEFLVAACSHDPTSIAVLLEETERYTPFLREYVTSGAAVFDEHNTTESLDQIHQELKHADHTRPAPVFRILDDFTRASSLQPFGWGVVLFNIPHKRIVQIQNSYMDVQRNGKVLTESAAGRLAPRVYQLPPYWRIVP